MSSALTNNWQRCASSSLPRAKRAAKIMQPKVCETRHGFEFREVLFCFPLVHVQPIAQRLMLRARSRIRFHAVLGSTEMTRFTDSREYPFARLAFLFGAGLQGFSLATCKDFHNCGRHKLLPVIRTSDFAFSAEIFHSLLVQSI